MLMYIIIITVIFILEVILEKYRQERCKSIGRHSLRLVFNTGRTTSPPVAPCPSDFWDPDGPTTDST